MDSQTLSTKHVIIYGAGINLTWTTNNGIDREQYEEDLRRRQEEHLKQVNKTNWRPCLHDQCSQCYGTGIKTNGQSCIHMISCPCPKCSPQY